MKIIYAIAENCPLACGPVFLMKRVSDGRVFAGCVSCGVAWTDPAKVGDLGKSEIHACLVADGSFIEYAPLSDIENAGLVAKAVTEITDDGYFSKWIEDYNATYGREPNLIEKARGVAMELRRLAALEPPK
jgi:hypothetical protein